MGSQSLWYPFWVTDDVHCLIKKCNCLDMVCMMIFGLLSSDDMSNSENRNSMSLVKYTKINCVNSKNSARMSSELLSYEFIGGWMSICKTGLFLPSLTYSLPRLFHHTCSRHGIARSYERRSMVPSDDASSRLFFLLSATEKVKVAFAFSSQLFGSNTTPAPYLKNLWLFCYAYELLVFYHIK